MVLVGADVDPWRAHWRVGVGALVFEGKSDTLFGAWTKNDLVWADLRWSF